MSRAIMMSGRELRRVPMDYKHPSRAEQFDRFKASGHPRCDSDAPASLHFGTYDEAIRGWWESREAWLRGERSDYFEEREGDPYTFEEYEGGPPDPAYYLRHPLPPESAENPYGIQLWETVSEGSPISPVFEDSDDGRRALAEWMAEDDTDSILSHLDAVGWLCLITGVACGTDVFSGELV